MKDDDGDHNVMVDRDDGRPEQGSGKLPDPDNGPLCSIYGAPDFGPESSCTPLSTCIFKYLIMYFSPFDSVLPAL